MIKTSPQIQILEQPVPRVRFRYHIPPIFDETIDGESSTMNHKTFPTIKIVGYTGPAYVIASCVTKDPPYKVHPHRLIDPCCQNGIIKVHVLDTNMALSFPCLGIEYTNRQDFRKALEIRQEQGVDPFGEGFGHAEAPESINLSVVRLCFQAFVKNCDGKVIQLASSVVSEPIYDIEKDQAWQNCLEKHFSNHV